jgi:hypothetical protein
MENVLFTLQGIMSISTHAFATYVQINHFCNYRCDYLPQHSIKTTCCRITITKWFKFSCICNLYLRTNVDLDENENTLKYHPFLMASQNR